MPNVPSVKYRAEFVPSFAQTVTLLADRCTDESMSEGASCVFDVSDMSGELPERGLDGNLARLNSNDVPITCTLKEYGGSFRITNMQKFESQSSERDKMYAKITGRVNRRLDRVLLAELAQGTTVWNGAAAITVDIATINSIIAELGEADAPVSPADVTWVVTPKFNGKLMGLPQYTSSDYVAVKPYASGGNQFTNERKIKPSATIMPKTVTFRPSHVVPNHWPVLSENSPAAIMTGATI
jgi:hypothetical protein